MGVWLELNFLVKAGLERFRVFIVGGRGGVGKLGVLVFSFSFVINLLGVFG